MCTNGTNVDRRVYPRRPLREGLVKITSWDEVDFSDPRILADLADMFSLILGRHYSGHVNGADYGWGVGGSSRASDETTKKPSAPRTEMGQTEAFATASTVQFSYPDSYRIDSSCHLSDPAASNGSQAGRDHSDAGSSRQPLKAKKEQ